MHFKRSILIMLLLGILHLLSACASSSGGSSSVASSSNLDSDFEDGDLETKENAERAPRSNTDLSANNTSFVYSLTNNPLTGKAVNPAKAQSEASKLQRGINPKSADVRRDFSNLMSAKRHGGASLDEVFGVAQKLITIELGKDIRRQLPEQAKLELALSSIQSQKFSMAEHWLNEISDTKNKRIKAAELTARGIIAKIDGRLPEAVDFWRQAVSTFPNYDAARLNLGMTAIQFGDYTTAKKMLGNMQDDWYALTGLMQAERISNNPRRAESLCSRILEKQPKYKPALFSCALNVYQGLGDLKKARAQLEAVSRVEGGPTVVDEKAFLIIGRIDKDLREQASNQSPKK